jgi:uncharacterized protein YkwD
MVNPTELESYFLQLVNADRAKAGAAALVFDAELIDSAGATHETTGVLFPGKS